VVHDDVTGVDRVDLVFAEHESIFLCDFDIFGDSLIHQLLNVIAAQSLQHCCGLFLSVAYMSSHLRRG
jgi:hypothetical protein